MTKTIVTASSRVQWMINTRHCSSGMIPRSRRTLVTTATGRQAAGSSPFWYSPFLALTKNHTITKNRIAPSSWQFQSSLFSTTNIIIPEDDNHDNTTTPTLGEDEQDVDLRHHIRLSKLLSQHTVNLAISRREAERLIRNGEVTVAGQTITSPHYLVDWKQDIEPSIQSPGIIKVSGKAVALLPWNYNNNGSSSDDNTDNNNNDNNVKVWIVHKLKGEVVADFDPQGRPSMMERLMRGGVGKQFANKKKHQPERRYHIKPIGRLDMMTEGLILVTTCGQYAREMELPSNQLHRTYRVRVHGPLTQYKVQAIQRGMRIDNAATGTVTRYAPMKVQLNNAAGKKKNHHRRRRPQQQRLTASTNTWIDITCTEGKNRQVRNVLQHLGLNVTRLIRISFGDYQLQNIPPGMALEVPTKNIKKQVHRGPLFAKKNKAKSKTNKKEEEASPIQWVRHYR